MEHPDVAYDKPVRDPKLFKYNPDVEISLNCD